MGVAFTEAWQDTNLVTSLKLVCPGSDVSIGYAEARPIFMV